MRIADAVWFYEAFKRIEGKIDSLAARLDAEAKKQEIEMAALDDKITALTAEVTRNTAVESSALTLINGIQAQIKAAVDAEVAAGATTAQLSAITALQTSLTNNDDALAAAVAANTVAQNPPPPGP